MKRRNFTLLEIMICLAVVAMIAGVMGVQVARSLSASRFQNSAKMVKQEIEKLQVLALTFGSDMQFEIKKEKGKFIAITRTDEAALKQLNGSKITLEGVTRISWLKDPKVKRLDILANGRILQEEVLGIHNETQAYFLDMRLPLQIKFVQKYDRDRKKPKEPEKPKDTDEIAKSSI